MKRIVLLLAGFFMAALMFSCKKESDERIPIETFGNTYRISDGWAWDYQKFPTYLSEKDTDEYMWGIFKPPCVLVFNSQEEIQPYLRCYDSAYIYDCPVFEFTDKSVLALGFSVPAATCDKVELRKDGYGYRFDVWTTKSPFGINDWCWVVGMTTPYIPKDANFEATPPAKRCTRAERDPFGAHRPGQLAGGAGRPGVPT